MTCGDREIDTPKDFEDDQEGESEGLKLPRTYTNGSMVEIEGDPINGKKDSRSLSERDFLDIKEETGSQTSLDDIFRSESISSTIIQAVIERQFNIDAVACTGAVSYTHLTLPTKA